LITDSVLVSVSISLASPPLSIEEDGFPVFVTDMYNSLHHSGRGVTSVYIVGDAIPRLIT
jgi:hypothetical protein